MKRLFLCENGVAAQKIADLKGISLEEIAKQTYENAMKIFEIEK